MRLPLIALAGTLASVLASALPSVPVNRDTPDRRVVDVVVAGDAASEAAHGYAGHLATAGTRDGVAFRVTAGWMRYAMHTFDDTEVTVVLVFARDSVTRQYDVVVEDSLVTSRTLAPAAARATTVEISVPFAVTRGKAEVSIVLRARGGPTPSLRELRTLQDHNEL